jgi:hypothetical protein
MNTHSETKSFLDDVEVFVHRKFQFRHDIELLVESSESGGMQSEFQHLIFYAKFLSNAYSVLKRVGFSSEEAEKLSVEFKTNMNKAVSILEMIINKISEHEKKRFLSTYCSLSQEGINSFLMLMYELSWVKNYLLDHERTSGR